MPKHDFISDHSTSKQKQDSLTPCNQNPKKDQIFRSNHGEKFEFNESVASVFDDMLERSIPFYHEVLNLGIYFILQHLQSIAKSCKEVLIYDLGSSTGNFLLKLDEALKAQQIEASLYGIDNSEAMIARSRLKANALNANITFIMQDFLQTDFLSADIIMAFYTMQFIRPLYRKEMVQKIYNALKPHGIFLLAEKVISHDSKLETQMISCYYDYKKKQGYTQNEIYKKREALENILVPYSIEENLQMLKSCGFSHVEILFKWVNFALFYVRK